MIVANAKKNPRLRAIYTIYNDTHIQLLEEAI